MTNPPEQPPGTPPPPNGPYGAPPPSPPPGWQQPGPPPGWQPPPPAQPVWQGHQAPQQWGPGWQQPPPPKRRTGLVIALVAAVLLVAGGGGAAALLLLARDGASGALAVSEVTAGMCLDSADLADGNSEVDDLSEVDCDGDHDAKVFAVLETAEDESFDDAGSRCAEALDERSAGKFDELTEAGIEVRPLAETNEPEEGDAVVCFLRREDGEKLSDDLV